MMYTSVLKLYNISFRRKMRTHGTPSKATITYQTRRPGHFPPASQAGRLAGPVFYVYVLSLAGATLLCTLLLDGGGGGGNGVSASC
jgi:hypothetical protein